MPQQWKEARIRPVPKVSAPVQYSDFRPISVTGWWNGLWSVTILARTWVSQYYQSIRAYYQSIEDNCLTAILSRDCCIKICINYTVYYLRHCRPTDDWQWWMNVYAVALMCSQVTLYLTQPLFAHGKGSHRWRGLSALPSEWMYLWVGWIRWSIF